MIAIRVDGNGKIGLGHMMRCISIACQLRENGIKVIFIISQDSEDSILIINVFCYFKLDSLVENGLNPEESMILIKRMKCKGLLIDSYRVQKSDFIKFKTIVNIAYIDDIYAFDYPVDLLINYNLEAKEFYCGKKRKDCVYLLGTKYFPLRKEFIQASKYYFLREVNNILIITGSTDPYGISLFLSDLLLTNFNGINIQILLGKFYDDQYVNEILEAVSREKRMEIVEWGNSMADIYAHSDLVITSGGTSCFEAMSMGIPCISYEFVDNHHLQCEWMKKLDLAESLGDLSCNLDEKKGKIVDIIKSELDEKIRIKRIHVYSKYFDDKGAERICDALINMIR